MTHTPDIQRPPRDLVDALAKVGTATASSELYKLGIRDPFIEGPMPHTKGRRIAGPALTLQFMPKREDLYGESEYTDREKQLHRHVLYHTQPGDIVVVDARGDTRSGILVVVCVEDDTRAAGQGFGLVHEPAYAPEKGGGGQIQYDQPEYDSAKPAHACPIKTAWGQAAMPHLQLCSGMRSRASSGAPAARHG